jgi:hypothetical protein
MAGGKKMSESRSTITLLRYLAILLFGVLVAVMSYGLYYFPAAPIRYVDGQYLDKRGQTHSREEFEHLHAWERIFIAAWIASGGGAVAFQVAKRRAR